MASYYWQSPRRKMINFVLFVCFCVNFQTFDNNPLFTSETKWRTRNGVYRTFVKSFRWLNRLPLGTLISWNTWSSPILSYLLSQLVWLLSLHNILEGKTECIAKLNNFFLSFSSQRKWRIQEYDKKYINYYWNAFNVRRWSL